MGTDLQAVWFSGGGEDSEWHRLFAFCSASLRADPFFNKKSNFIREQFTGQQDEGQFIIELISAHWFMNPTLADLSFVICINP